MKQNNNLIQREVIEYFQKYSELKIIDTVFIPVGHESYSYKLTTHDDNVFFIKYCEHHADLQHINLVQTLLTELRHSPFVIPPISINDYSTIDTAHGKMFIYPFVVGEVIDQPNDHFDTKLVSDITEIVASIHTARVKIDLPQESFENQFLDQYNLVKDAIVKNQLDEEVTDLFLQHKKAIRELIRSHSESGRMFRITPPPFVLTHGDITGLNIMRTKHGLKLVDWDGAMFAPLERDLMFLVVNGNFSRQKYLKLSSKSSIESKLIEYYTNEWALNSIVGNFERLVTENHGDEDIKFMLGEIEEYLKH